VYTHQLVAYLMNSIYVCYYDNITYSMLCAERNVCDTNVLKVGHICKVVWSPTLHCRPLWMY